MQLDLFQIAVFVAAKLALAAAVTRSDPPRVHFLFLALDRIQRLDVWKRFFDDAPVDQYRLIFHCKDPVACKAQLRMSGLFDESLGKQVEVIDHPAQSAYCTDLVSAENTLLDVALRPPFTVAGSPAPAKASSFVDTNFHSGQSPTPSPQSFLAKQEHFSNSTSKVKEHRHDKFGENPHDKFVFVSDSTIPVKSFSRVHWSLTTEGDSHFCIFPREQWATSNRNPCVDDDNRCAGWAQNGECERNPNYMHYKCQRSCQVCNDDLGKLAGNNAFDDHRIVAVKTHQWKVLNRADAIKAVQLWKQGYLRHLMHMMHLNWHDSFRNHGCLDEFWHFAALYGAFPSHCMGKRNAHPSCSGWALQGECERNPVYMWKQCEAACSKCQLKYGYTKSLTLENGAELQGTCDTFVKWPTASAMGRNNGMAQLDQQLSGLVTMQGGSIARPQTISEISPWGLVTFQKSAFLFVRKFTANSKISGDCTSMADIFSRDVLLKTESTRSAWVGQGVWQVDEVNDVVLMTDPKAEHGFVVHNNNMPMWSGKGTHCGNRISITFKNEQAWNGQVDTSNGDFIMFDNGVIWCRDMSWRGDGAWLNTYNASVQIRTTCGHKVAIHDTNPDWSAKGKLDKMLGDTVVATFNKKVKKEHVKLTGTIAPDGQSLQWHNGQIWTRDEKHWVPCACTPDGALWQQPLRPEGLAKAKPRCFFFDLGPEDGHHDLDQFLVGYYAIPKHFKPQDCEIIVIDPDPKKAAYLKRQKNIYSTSFWMTAMPRTAAYSCEPPPPKEVEFADGRLNPAGSGGTKISVVNIQRMLRELALPQDHVVLRMDVGGLERDILSCLARSSAARLVDVMYLKKYGADASPFGVTDNELADALGRLKQSGVEINDIQEPKERPGSNTSKLSRFRTLARAYGAWNTR